MYHLSYCWRCRLLSDYSPKEAAQTIVKLSIYPFLRLFIRYMEMREEGGISECRGLYSQPGSLYYYLHMILALMISNMLRRYMMLSLKVLNQLTLHFLDCCLKMLNSTNSKVYLTLTDPRISIILNKTRAKMINSLSKHNKEWEPFLQFLNQFLRLLIAIIFNSHT